MNSWAVLSRVAVWGKKKRLLQNYLSEHKIEISLKITCPFFTEMEAKEVYVTHSNSMWFESLVRGGCDLAVSTKG